ncbi:MAG: hypothetical protein ABSB33_00765 [Tepidisphaeraceae bacterium]|jgi:hypothetical protein
MTTRWLAAILAAVLALRALATAAAESPSAEPTTHPTPQVLALVRDLTSDQFSTRQIAQSKLEQMGEEAAPQLQEMLKDSTLSDEAAARIRAALLRIQQGRQFGPSIITIHCHDAPLAGVLEDFASQAGADLGVDRPEIRPLIASKKISLDLDHVDFWTALRAVENGSGLHAGSGNGNGRMILGNFDWYQPWRDHARVFGPCLIAPQSVTWSIIFGPGAQTSSNLSVQLAVMIEPKLRAVGAFAGNWMRQCVGEKGHDLVRPGPPMNFGGGVRQWYVPLTTNLQVVPGMGRKIAKLKGELAFDVQTKSELLELENLSSVHDVTRSAGDNTITIQTFDMERGQYQLHISIGGPAASSGRWDIMQNLTSSLEILDGKDLPLQLISTSSTSSIGGQMSMTLGYFANSPAVGPPKKLRWEITTETRHMTIPFELDDIDLPHAEDELH